MSYKVQLKDKGSIIIKGEKFPYNQIKQVSKSLFDYIKDTFPTKFNLFGEAPKKAEKKAEEVKEKVAERAEEKVAYEGKGYTKKSSKK